MERKIWKASERIRENSLPRPPEALAAWTGQKWLGNRKAGCCLVTKADDRKVGKGRWAGGVGHWGSTAMWLVVDCQSAGPTTRGRAGQWRSAARTGQNPLGTAHPATTLSACEEPQRKTATTPLCLSNPMPASLFWPPLNLNDTGIRGSWNT